MLAAVEQVLALSLVGLLPAAVAVDNGSCLISCGKATMVVLTHAIWPRATTALACHWVRQLSN